MLWCMPSWGVCGAALHAGNPGVSLAGQPAENIAFEGAPHTLADRIAAFLSAERYRWAVWDSLEILALFVLPFRSLGGLHPFENLQLVMCLLF